MSSTAKLVYSVLLYRAFLSQKNSQAQKNKWIDSQGRIYINYSVAEMAKTIHKGETVVKEALSDLNHAGLIERHRNFSAPNTIYVKVPAVRRKTDCVIDEKAAISETEKRPCEGRKSDQQTAGKATTKKNIENKSIEKDIENAPPPAALSVERTPIDVFTEFAKGNAPLLKALTEFDQHRREIRQADKKRPWTALAAKKICARLQQLANEANVKDCPLYMIACIDQSIENGWLSVFPVKDYVEHRPCPYNGAERLQKSLNRISADSPRKITKDMSLEELIMGGGIQFPEHSAPAAQKGEEQHE